MECVVTGEGPALVALHGAMGGCDQSWLLARALLGEVDGRRVIAVSRPGYLGTRLSLGRTPEAQADLYAEVLDALGIEQAVLAAVSAGGPSALEFAWRRPDRCGGLVLVSACTGRLEITPEVRSRMRMMRLAAFVPGLGAVMRSAVRRDPDASARRAIADPEALARTLNHPEARDLMRALQASVADRFGQRLPGTLADIQEFAGLARNWNDRRIEPPLLAVHGEDDPVAPLGHAEAAARSSRCGKLIAIKGGGHAALFSALDVVREAMSGFLVEHGL